MNTREQDFYQKLRKQIKTWLDKTSKQQNRWTEFILLAPDFFHLLCKLMLDKEMPSKKKVKLAAAIAYFISPLDILPEAILGPVGYLDDVALTAYVLNDIINEVNPQIITRNWAGDRDILNLVKTILANSDKMLGSGVWRKIRTVLK
jgi:uncharacterized membrane protein YkvA (DUF1232 family)